MNFTDEIKQTILEGIPEAEVHILDPLHDGVHLEAVVISSAFVGKSLVKQHQMVMHLLQEHFETNLHALGLKTFTPEKWESLDERSKNN